MIRALTPSPARLKVAALGDSLIAGMQDDRLDARAQERGFVKQFAHNAGLPFEVPYLRGSGGPVRLFSGGHLSLYRTMLDYSWLHGAAALPVAWRLFIGIPPALLVNAACRLTAVVRKKLGGPQQNFGVPGFKLQDVVDVRGGVDYINTLLHHRTPSNFAPLVLPLARSILGPEGKSQLERTIEAQPDMVVLSGGANDVLAGTEGVVDDAHLTPMEDRPWRLQDGTTTTEVLPGLKTSMTTLLDRLRRETSAEIFVCNLPDVTSIPGLLRLGDKLGPLPFRVKWRGQDLTQALEDTLLPLTIRGPGKDGRTEFPLGSKVSIHRVLTNTRLLTCLSSGKPIPAELFGEDQVADPDELATIRGRVDEYNRWLSEVAAQDKRIHVLDIHDLLTHIGRGQPLTGRGPLTWVGNTFTGAHGDGWDGVFSYDGTHPSDVGQAMIANTLLRTVQRDLGDDPRFSFFQHVAPINERAVYEADPHRRHAVMPDIDSPLAGLVALGL